MKGLHADPVLALAVSGRRSQRPLRPAQGREAEGLCSQPTLSRVYARLATPENRVALGEFLRAAAARRAGARGRRRLREVTVDLDSLPVEVHGEQPGSVYNGHYGCGVTIPWWCPGTVATIWVRACVRGMSTRRTAGRRLSRRS